MNVHKHAPSVTSTVGAVSTGPKFVPVRVPLGSPSWNRKSQAVWQILGTL